MKASKKSILERVKALFKPQDDDEDLDKQYPVNARETWRRERAYRERRRRKGQRAFVRQQLEQARNRDVVAAQLHVLQTKNPGDPIYDNVYNALVAKHGEDFLRAGGQ